MSVKAHRRRPEEVHLIPDVLGVAALAVPFVTTGSGVSQSAVEALMSPNDIGTRLQNGMTAVVDATVTNWKSIAELGILAIVAKWGGKKLGLNRIGTKRVKIA